ncbi:MAG: ribose 5-phosphate isomerase B [Vicinamibacterales bacterium]
MRVALGADHAGVHLKDALKAELDALGVGYDDCGTSGPASVDYPDFAVAVARAVSEGRADRGVLVCGSGIGMAIAANKVPGVRAAAIGDLDSARLSREHNDLNVLALGARLTPAERAAEILRVFLSTPFEGGRHVGRVAKIHSAERIGAAER